MYGRADLPPEAGYLHPEETPAAVPGELSQLVLRSDRPAAHSYSR